MTLTVKRNDEFFDYIVNYYFFLNGEKYKLAHNQEIEIDLPAGEYEVYSRYYWLKSKKKKISVTDKDAKIEIKLFMNRNQWFKLLAVIGACILLAISSNEFLQELGLFFLKSWMAFYLFMLTVGSDRFMRLIFKEENKVA